MNGQHMLPLGQSPAVRHSRNMHPVDHAGSPASGTHNVSFYCDDLEQTVAELRGRGVEFLDAISDQGYATTIHFEMPGGVKVELYQPKY